MKTKKIICIWQLMVTPHMAFLASALAKLDITVIYIAEEKLSKERFDQGWCSPEMQNVSLLFKSSYSSLESLLNSLPSNAIHVCQGIRMNGYIGDVQQILKARNIKFWVIMETVNDSGFLGSLKRIIYKYKFHLLKKKIYGVMAIGSKTSDWLIKRGVASDVVFPFAYFIDDYYSAEANDCKENKIFNFIFAGQLIDRKRVDILIHALSMIPVEYQFVLKIVGNGTLESYLKTLGSKFLGEKVIWLGTKSMNETRQLIRNADCLVLPSFHDGWGAVVSEALMLGTPVICSETCGASEVVNASKHGSVFLNGDINQLSEILLQFLKNGPQKVYNRKILSEWSKVLGATAGAKYLLDIVTYNPLMNSRPKPPWSEK